MCMSPEILAYLSCHDENPCSRVWEKEGGVQQKSVVREAAASIPHATFFPSSNELETSITASP